MSGCENERVTFDDATRSDPERKRAKTPVSRRLPLRRSCRTAAGFAALAMLVLPVLHMDSAAAASATSKQAAAAKKVTSPLPVMNVTDVTTGKPVPLAATFDGTKPMLVWFWSPH